MSSLTFVEEWDEDEPIAWRAAGRKRLNVVIRAFNDWQRQLGMGDESTERPRMVRILIEEARQTWAQRDGGSAWLEELDKMDEIAKAFLDQDAPCYCAETATRNCPRHQNGDER